MATDTEVKVAALAIQIRREHPRWSHDRCRAEARLRLMQLDGAEPEVTRPADPEVKR